MVFRNYLEIVSTCHLIKFGIDNLDPQGFTQRHRDAERDAKTPSLKLRSPKKGGADSKTSSLQDHNSHKY